MVVGIASRTAGEIHGQTRGPGRECACGLDFYGLGEGSSLTFPAAAEAEEAEED